MFLEERKLLFISYSHKDRPWLEEFKVHFAPYTRGDCIIQLSTWSDDRIEPGAKWLHEIGAAIATAKVAILLVTSDSLASEFIMDHELPLILSAAENGALRFSWIHVKPSSYERTPLSKYQAVIEPDVTLQEMPAPKRARAWLRICRALEALLTTPIVEESFALVKHDVVPFHGLNMLLRDLEGSIVSGELQHSPLGPMVVEQLKLTPVTTFAEHNELSWIVNGIRKSDYYLEMCWPLKAQLDWESDFAEVATSILVGVARTLNQSPAVKILLKELCDRVAARMDLRIIWPTASSYDEALSALYDACRQARDLEDDDVLYQLRRLIVVGRF